MKQIITDNQALLEVLAEEGFSLICDPLMRITITDEEEHRIYGVVAEKAPAAMGDFEVREIGTIVYANHDEAIQAAKEYQEAHGGIIYDEIIGELFDDFGDNMGDYGQIVVGTGEGSEPFGDSWETFYYEP